MKCDDPPGRSRAPAVGRGLFPRSVIGSAGLVLALACLAGCEAGRRPADGEAAAHAGLAEAPTPAMRAHSSFFSGRIGIEVLLNRTGFSGRSQEPVQDAGDRGFTRAGGGFGSGRRRGQGGPGAGPGGDSQPAARVRESTLPPVRLHVRLTNTGSTASVVSVSDLESALGNFVVEPEKITLPPHQPVETEPMTYRLGVSSEEIPVKISIKLEGQTETQTLVLKVVPDEAPTPPHEGR